RAGRRVFALPPIQLAAENAVDDGHSPPPFGGEYTVISSAGFLRTVAWRAGLCSGRARKTHASELRDSDGCARFQSASALFRLAAADSGRTPRAFSRRSRDRGRWRR